MTPKIETPRGVVFTNKAGKAQLQWNTNFQPKWQRSYTRAQKFVDSEVLRQNEPFIPLLTGTLIKSGILGTDIGSGLVQWITPYAKRQYYRGRAPGTSSFGPLRGRYWFERWKEIGGPKLIRDARKLAGRG